MFTASRHLHPWALAGAIALAAAACGNTSSRASASDDAPAVAIVAGEPISAGELERALGHRLAQLEAQAYELKKEQLDELIAARLLAAEAKRRGVSVEALLEAEVASKIEPVTGPDVDAFIASNRARLPADTGVLRPRIQAFLEAQREAERRTAYVEALRADADVEVRLPRPKVYRAAVSDSKSPARGPADAPVTVVEFSDFHCPFCRSVQPTLNALLEKYPDDVRLVYRHLPLDQIHPRARRAAEASWCADEQGRFWPYHDKLYAGGSDASDATLTRLAVEAGLDVGAFESCLASGRAREPVQQDVEEATRHGISGTPGFLINGRLVSGNLPLSAFVDIVEEELQEGR